MQPSTIRRTRHPDRCVSSSPANSAALSAMPSFKKVTTPGPAISCRPNVKAIGISSAMSAKYSIVRRQLFFRFLRKLNCRRSLDDGWEILIVAHPRRCNNGVRWLHEPPQGKTRSQTTVELDFVSPLSVPN
jgi:hypothetical protein